MAFSETLKLKVRRRAHFTCCLCHALGPEVHHIVPQGEGGDDNEDNAAPLCPSCHETYGANSAKRKFIREARDCWYEICEKRYASDPDRLDEIGSMLNKAATKHDLDAAVERLVELIRGLVRESDRPTKLLSGEIAQVGGFISAGVGVNRQCKNCGTSIGLYIGDQGKCPQCGMPW